MLAAETIVVVCALVILYTLLLYPAVMAAIGFLAERRLRKEPATPYLTLIVAACNEEQYIGRMIRQVVEADYPRDRLEVLIASDAGSTDRTHEIVRTFAHEGIRLCLPAPGLIGKNVSLDEAVRTSRGEILVFADATAIWTPDTLRQLAANFADPAIGCVSARKAYWLEDGFGPHSYRAYWDLEGLVDRGSSVFGYIPNASGGLHALRRSIYRAIPNHMIHDLVDPAQAVGDGYLAVLDPAVTYVDAPWLGAREVYRARVRITMRALSSTRYIIGQLLKARRYLAVLQFVSHKLLRWFLWAPVLGLLAASLALAPYSPLYAALALLQLLLGAVALLPLTGTRAAGRLPWLAHLSFFVLSLAAMAQGFVLWLSGRKKATWRLRGAGAAG